ncbi:MAG TPA: MFS transporter [Candidatus Gallacutalibacter pullistercoris]|nr:MFS transporter [Candidatus Gallacutalibacter pullistercoris]
MATLLLLIIYLSFISLGLPDSLLGSAWPVMYGELSVPVSWAGIISMIISGGTIISSFFSERIIRRLGTGLVTFVSVAMTAAALLGFALLPGFWWLCLCAIPLGLGAGSVDSALNNFVALHYKAMHMNWLHCFWGIGASLGPVIMSIRLAEKNGWKQGYLTISLMQFFLVAVLLAALPLWKIFSKRSSTQAEEEAHSLSLRELLSLRGAKAALIGFFCYCAVESTTGIWGSTYLVQAKGISPDIAAQWVSLFYIGITVGRAISGFITMKLDSRRMIRLGEVIILAGVLLLLLPLGDVSLFWGLFAIGLGCAPIYPAMLHLTPENFGEKNSQSIMGIQMACAYVGATFMPPLFGLIAQDIDANWFPIYIMGFLLLMCVMTFQIDRKLAHPSK